MRPKYILQILHSHNHASMVDNSVPVDRSVSPMYTQSQVLEDIEQNVSYSPLQTTVSPSTGWTSVAKKSRLLAAVSWTWHLPTRPMTALITSGQNQRQIMLTNQVKKCHRR